MRRFFMFGFLLFVTSISTAQSKKILIVSTNIDSVNNSSNGTFLMEIAYPLASFHKAGVDVDVVTPRGGKAAIYHRGEMAKDLEAIQESRYFFEKTNHTLAPHQVKIEDYAGIFYPGGGGQFYDVVYNDSIASIAAHIHDRGGVIGAAGHGAVSLIHIKVLNGEHLVAGARLTAFPKSISAKWLPIDWETELRDRGATLLLPQTALQKDKGIEVVDASKRLITGSYAENAQWVAEQMMKMIGSSSL